MNVFFNIIQFNVGLTGDCELMSVLRNNKVAACSIDM